MRLWTLVKILAAVVVFSIVTLTGMLVYHVTVRPLAGPPNWLIPDAGMQKPPASPPDIKTILNSPDIPQVDPGEHVFEQARELLALGRPAQARDKLTTIQELYPRSPSAASARRIIGEMNLDEILGTARSQRTRTYTVKPGDSYLAIAGRNQTTIDCLIHFNSMMELKGIQPGDEFVVMPLNFRVVVDTTEQQVSLWDGESFVCSYPALSMRGVPRKASETTIQAKIADLDGRRVPSHSEDYRAAGKVIQTAPPSVQIRSWQEPVDGVPMHGVLLKPRHMEELALLTRSGNVVVIR